MPGPSELTDESRRIAARSATIATSTARHFNQGVRGFYFGLAALSWFLHPWLFVALTAWVVLVLYRREFRSRLLKTLGIPETEQLAGTTPAAAQARSSTAPAGAARIDSSRTAR